MKTDLAVIGAGPAGLCAAIEAAKMGAHVLLIDENRKAGGQLFKQIHRFFGSEEHLAGIRGIDIGTMLLVDAEKYGVHVLLNTVVWGLFPDMKLGISDGEKVSIVDAERIIVSTGASENSLSFSGWTLPNGSRCCTNYDQCAQSTARKTGACHRVRQCWIDCRLSASTGGSRGCCGCGGPAQRSRVSGACIEDRENGYPHTHKPYHCSC